MSWTFRDKITDFVTRLATTARQRRDNFKKKSHHHRKQKIARVAAALEQGLGLRLLRTDIDEVFHPLEKRTNKKQKPRWIWILWEMSDWTPLKILCTVKMASDFPDGKICETR